MFCKTDIVLEKTTGGYTIPLLDDCPTPLKEWSQVLEIGTMPDDGTPIKAVSIDMALTDSLYSKCVDYVTAIINCRSTLFNGW